MTPTNRTYFDYYQGDPAAEPLAIGGFLPLDSVYAFEPVPGELTPEQAAHVLGAPGKRVDRIHPDAGAGGVHAPAPYAGARRGALVAEGGPELDRFVARLPAQFARLDALGAEYRVPEAVRDGSIRPDSSTGERRRRLPVRSVRPMPQVIRSSPGGPGVRARGDDG